MKRILTIAFICIIIFGFTTVLKIYASPDTPKIYVNPKDNIFSPETTVVGDTFTVSINTSGWEDPGLYGYEFKVFFDPTLLNTTKGDVEYPDGHFMDWTDNFPTPVIINYDEGFILLGGILLGDVPGSTGDGIFATITFTIIAAPPPTRSCDLAIGDISFLDPDGDLITDYEVENGYYEFSAPKPPVYLKVEPETVSAAEVGDEVIIDVTINEIESTLELANVTFELSYNTTLLSTKDEWVTPGQTFVSFNVTIEADYVEANIQMVTEPPFPAGKVTLATIKFNATYIPPTLTTSPLSLSDVVLTDIGGNIIEYDHLEDGLYQVPTTIEKEDLNGDGRVDINDLYVFAQAFFSYPGHPRWDESADMNGDGEVNVIDAVLIAMKFHDYES